MVDNKLYEFMSVCIDSKYQFSAPRWLKENQIEFQSFTVFDKPYNRIGFCFLNEHDSLLFALRWA